LELKIELVRTFVAIAGSGSFKAAAHRLGVGQPAISKQMAKLEQELETRLFIRESRGVRLTTAGEALLLEARRIVELNDRAIAVARAAGQAGAVGSRQPAEPQEDQDRVGERPDLGLSLSGGLIPGATGSAG
jgi:DNA-binding transcriptional LysR family regulator